MYACLLEGLLACLPVCLNVGVFSLNVSWECIVLFCFVIVHLFLFWLCLFLDVCVCLAVCLLLVGCLIDYGFEPLLAFVLCLFASFLHLSIPFQIVVVVALFVASSCPFLAFLPVAEK